MDSGQLVEDQISALTDVVPLLVEKSTYGVNPSAGSKSTRLKVRFVRDAVALAANA
jgi:hypothetical protein